VDVIETERLLLEPLDARRLEDFIALTADPDAMRYWGAGGPFTRDVAERNFAASLDRLRQHGFGRRWIVSKTDSVGLGFTETKHFGASCDAVSPDEIEIGWMLFPSAWGRGYGTEAGRAIRDEAFDRLELASIVPSITPATPRPGGSWKSSAWSSKATSLLVTGGRTACIESRVNNGKKRADEGESTSLHFAPRLRVFRHRRVLRQRRASDQNGSDRAHTREVGPKLAVPLGKSNGWSRSAAFADRRLPL